MWIYLIGAFLLVYALWIFYLAVMNLKRAKDSGTLTKVALYLGYPALYLGLLLDLLANIFVLTVLFLELPKETLVTYRLKRIVREETGWRLKLARWFADHLLDTFDPSGKHI